ncbi:MAG: hypothetical protein KatS3mg120_1316 [Erythrobacter sp.]|nr:MAG: hypothetical protein KatS3mg120_1316 [Erythrobacter sp.]
MFHVKHFRNALSFTGAAGTALRRAKKGPPLLAGPCLDPGCDPKGPAAIGRQKFLRMVKLKVRP